MTGGFVARWVALAAVGLLISACEPADAPAPIHSSDGASASPSAGASSASGPTLLSCAAPIDIEQSPVSPHRAVLDAVALDTTATVQASDAGGSAPHRLFAKTALLVHADIEAEVDVLDAWANRAAIAWGNNAAEWTTRLRIPACSGGGPGGDWLVYPGGLSVDEPACVPLEVSAGGKTETVHLAVGVHC